MRETFHRVKDYLERHERPLSAVALVFGFVMDSLTLSRIDLLSNQLVLFIYLCIVGFCIIILALQETRIAGHPVLLWAVTIAPLIMQIVFGGLFSALVVFYSRSASFSASWPFILFLIGMLIGNETFRARYERMVFRVSIFFIALLSFSVLIVPVVLHSIGVLPFLLSVSVSIILVYCFILLLTFFSREHVYEVRHVLMQSIGIITIVYMIAYITNIIPPVPLALKDFAVAHSVVRVDDGYRLSVEPHSLSDYFQLSEIYHRTPGEPVYIWTSVFAPTKLSTAIVHNWQYKEGNSWKTASRISFPITGGSDGGYRGYSMKENLGAGAWRVSVETSRGQVIGRVRFDIVDVGATQPQQLIEK
ncbi:MAG: DUF2914 domain-containing protein [Candidatus Campbellbacteria bacterium]|nr:DUF2914 domain-containing protein [Candidatus Campbellbacteria bacterium]